jgi:hypothetical protein
MALGVAWILDGLEITIASNVGPDLTLRDTLNTNAGSVSDIAWWYLIGEVIGALFFGRFLRVRRGEPARTAGPWPPVRHGRPEEAIAQLFGAFGSHWYGHLIGTGQNRTTLFIGYVVVGAGAMIIGGIVAIFFGVNAEGKALEDVATPLGVVGKPAAAIFRSGADREGIDPIEAAAARGRLLKLQPVLAALVGDIGRLGEVRDLAALDCQVGGRAQRAER